MTLVALFALLLSFANCGKVSSTHSILRQFDSSIAENNWKYGGSTVVTNHFARLTTGYGKNSGWLFSHNPLPGKIWEVSIELLIKNTKLNLQKNSVIAICIQDNKEEFPSIIDEARIESLAELISGKRGFTLLITIKDSDMAQINVIDHMDAAVLKNIDSINLLSKVSTASKQKNSCFLKVKNVNYPIKISVKYTEKLIYGFVKSSEKNQKKEKMDNCLDVKLKEPIKNKAFVIIYGESQMGGDVINLRGLTTHYIPEKETGYENEKSGESSTENPKVFLSNIEQDAFLYRMAKRTFWMLVVVSGMLVLLEGVWEIIHLNEFSPERINPKQSIDAMNAFSKIAFGLKVFLTIVFLLRFEFLSFFYLAIPLSLRLKRIIRKNDIAVKPSELDDWKERRFHLCLLWSQVLGSGLFSVMAIDRLVSF